MHPVDELLVGWCIDIVHGPGQLEDYESHEMAVSPYGERVSAVIWALKALGNQLDEKTTAVVEAINANRARRKAASLTGSRGSSRAGHTDVGVVPGLFRDEGGDRDA